MKQALVLSGGGAKGSFQVGALQYLYEHGVRPSVISGTSVGAINALKLSEGEGTEDQGLRGLEKIWLGLRDDDDMFLREPWVLGLADWIKDALASGFSNVKILSVPEELQALILAVVPLVAADALNDLKEFAEQLTKNKSLFNLEPIETWARQNLDMHKIIDSGITLRMAVVSVDSGALRYVTERGKLVTHPGSASDDSSAPSVGLIDGMLASAAIPLAFRPRKLDSEWYVDGGVREVVPISAALSFDPAELFVIVAPIALPVERPNDNRGAVDIANRSIDIMSEEVISEDLRAGWDAGRILHVIRPRLEIEGSRTIDPGLIRMNMAYGYMRAFDVLATLKEEPFRSWCYEVSDLIAGKRKEIWDLENQLERERVQFELMLLAGNGGPLAQENFAARSSLLVNQLRFLKSELQGLVECRRIGAGSMSLPHDADEWWLNWEKHTWNVERIAPSPWSPTPMWPFSFPVAVQIPVPFIGCKTPSVRSAASGNYIQSDWSSIGNFEAFFVVEGEIRHLWRDGNKSDSDWNQNTSLPHPSFAGLLDDLGRMLVLRPAGVSVIQDRGPRALYPHGDFEAVALYKGPTLSCLSECGWDAKRRVWSRPKAVVHARGAVVDVVSNPALFQSVTSLGIGRELFVVHESGGVHRISHYWRSAKPSSATWTLVGDLPMPLQSGVLLQRFGPSAVCALQATPSEGQQFGDLLVVALFRNEILDAGYMVMYRLRDFSLGWEGPTEIRVAGEVLDNVEGRPVIIQSDWDRNRLELLCIRSGVVQHFGLEDFRLGGDWFVRSNMPAPSPMWVEDRAFETKAKSISAFQGWQPTGPFGRGTLKVLAQFEAVPGGDFLATMDFRADSELWTFPRPVEVGGTLVRSVARF